MLYFTPPSSKSSVVREGLKAGLLGAMITPKQGNVLPDGCLIGADTGIFHPTQFPGPGWPGETKWFAWLGRMVARYGADRFVFATAPDVPFDAAGTLRFSGPWLARIRGLGVPAAFCAQNGSEDPGMIPWDDVDVVFLAGDDDWKLGTGAADVAAEARRRGKRVHMGRVNSWERMKHAAAIGVSTTDGTTVIHGPDKNGADMIRWSKDIREARRHSVQPDLLGGRLVVPGRAPARPVPVLEDPATPSPPDPYGTLDLLDALDWREAS